MCVYTKNRLSILQELEVVTIARETPSSPRLNCLPEPSQPKFRLNLRVPYTSEWIT